MESIRLQTDHLDFEIDNTRILKDISLQIHDGETVGLIGPNGCGKTTLLKNIYRIYKPSKGAVFLDGSNIKTLSGRAVAGKMAVLAQEHGSVFDFPVIEIVLMGRYSHKKLLESNDDQDYSICEKALSLVGLTELRDRSFLSLSGGEKQRVLLAAAFAQEAGVIILDEPTNHLDIGYQLLIMDIIQAQRETTIFASIHDMNIAAEYCNRIIAMKHGAIIAVGTPLEVLTVDLIRDLFQVHAKIGYDEESGSPRISFTGAVK
jgi:iron complex transport system ATP-binding protein